MNLFSSKKNTKSAGVAAMNPLAIRKEATGAHHDVLKAPWLSEKALIGTENGVYVFEVPRDATKYDIADAVTHIYGVTPRQIRVVNLPAKRKALRTRRGFGSRAARHKAYVYLKKGETIQF